MERLRKQLLDFILDLEVFKMVLEKIEGGEPDQSYTYLIYQEKLLDGTILIKAKNGNTGRIDFKGTDASTVIQSAINALTLGGVIFVKNGVYQITKRIGINHNNIRLKAESYKTVLRAESQLASILSTKYDPKEMVEGISIEGFCLDGNKLVNYGIMFLRCKKGIIRNNICVGHKNFLDNNPACGIGWWWTTPYPTQEYDQLALIEGNYIGPADMTGPAVGSWESSIFLSSVFHKRSVVRNNFVNAGGGRGIELEDNASDVLVEGNILRGAGVWTAGATVNENICILDNHFYDKASVQIHPYGKNITIVGNTFMNFDGGAGTGAVLLQAHASHVTIANNVFFNCKPLSICLKDSKYVSVLGNVVREGKAIGVADGMEDVTVSGNIVTHDGIYVNNPAGGGVPIRVLIEGNIVDLLISPIPAGSAGIYVKGTECTVIGNRARGFDYGIRNVTDANTFIGNDVRGNTVAFVLDVAPLTIKDNAGYTTEKCGTATILSGATSVVVAHGLAGTPKVAKHCPRANLGAVWVSARDGTNITLNVATAPTADTITDWEVEM